MYGSHLDSYSKIEKDILDCLDNNKINIPKEKIQKIICGHISTNIHIDQFEKLKKSANIEEILLIGIDTLSHDLLINYHTLTKDYLGIDVDTGQVLSNNDFVTIYDKNKTSSPLDMKLLFREKEQEEI